MSGWHSVTAVTGVRIGSKIITLGKFDLFLDQFTGQSCTPCAQALMLHTELRYWTAFSWQPRK
jgi:hypothetical protein